MKYYSNKRLTNNSQELRRNMTPQERKLWYECLKGLPYCVKRQYVVDNYILDFYCAKTKIAIEIDGSQHYEQQGIAKDEARTARLNELGITVLRYSNYDINTNFNGVCDDIMFRFGLLEE